MLNKKGGIAISQILILVIGIVGIGYAIGSEVGFVRGDQIAEYENYLKNHEELTPTRNPLPFDEWKKAVYPDSYISQQTPARTPSTTGNPGAESPPDPNIVGGVAVGFALLTKGEKIGELPISNYLDGTTTMTDAAKQSLAKQGYTNIKPGESFIKEGMGYKIGADKITQTNYEGIWAGMGKGFLGNIAEGFVWAGIVYGMINMFGPILGLEEAAVDAASLASFAGIMAGKGAIGAAQQWNLGKAGTWITAKHWGLSGGAWIGIGVAALIFYKTYKSESQETITFTCESWDAPVGGNHCEKCNQQGGLPCSEYQCRSLGQACELLNPGTDEEKCVWVNKNDVTFPTIKPWENALLDNYDYRPDNAISPPDRGVIVWNKESTTGCAKAFTPLSFGIITDEPAKCKLDYLRKNTFDEMQFYFGGSSLLKYNHTQVMSLPGPSNLAAENITLENDGEFELYVRCQDANGNHNTANFVFKYCVEKGPDTTPPLIVTTNLLNGMPIAYNQTSIDLEAYTNEPADCKWSHLDQSYDDMEEDMTCSSSILEINAQMLYKCSTTLTGLKNREDNKFYFRCKDKPLESEDRNVNAESYEFVLIGTQPLIIDSVEPNETVRDSTEIVKVTLEAETSAGHNEGEAVCYYSNTGDDDSYVMFFETNSYVHSQELWLTSGDYEYFLKCIDLGGNSDIEIVNFDVESDSSAPIVVRAYHEETYLKLVTNEEAECVYDSVDCNYLFDDGTKMTTVDDADHFTDWNTKTNFYIKCQDEYGNQPLPNECSIIVKPFKVYEE